MAIRRVFAIGIPIAMVAIAIGAISQKRVHKSVHVSVRHAAKVRPAAPVPPPPMGGSFVSLTQIEDDEIASTGFSLSQPYDVRVYAVGEGMSNQMYDYGWILNAETRQPVWKMEYRDTHRAGGASKNRMVNDVITLDPGKYLVYYMTDGSHSWDDWNSAAPSHENAWGITLLAAEGEADESVIGRYDISNDESIIAQLVAIRDDDSRRQAFTLEDETTVRIYALGEGDRSEMYDYAWIEDADTRRDIWEMTYRKTDHAGGAQKNRLFDGTIVLPAGEYYLRYESDGSHSLEDWNSTPPRDPFSYGVTLYRVGN